MFTELNLKKVYDTETSNLIKDFYVPVLSNSVKYKRITGYFSAGSLSAAAQGIFSFIINNGHYQLIMGNQISNDDFNALAQGVNEPEKLLNFDLNDCVNSNSQSKINNLKLLSWMIASKKIDIKIAFAKNSSQAIFHEKIGIFEDNKGNILSFSGSVNETASGWNSNIEEFKVFKGWAEEERPYLSNDIEKFEKYWNGLSDSVLVIDLPIAIEKKLLLLKPETEQELNEIIEKEKNAIPSYSTLREYQQTAVKNWINNDRKGLFEMATGTGKTITALAAARSTLKENALIVIVVPQTHLISQWKKDVISEIPNTNIVDVFGGNTHWKSDLGELLSNYRDGFSSKNNIIITTYSTLSSESFLSIFNQKYSSLKKYLIIADEMHSFGSNVFRKGMLNQFVYRLGLSATPSRWFDEEGSKESLLYFDKVVFEYGLKKAIEEGHLTPYNYYPNFVSLTKEEYQEYKRLSFQLLSLYSKSNNYNEKSEFLERILIKRSRVLKKCENKMLKFSSIATQLKEERENHHLLVYCESTDQLEEAQKILNNIGIISHTFTQAESDEEREDILKKFSEGTYECLLAMKCLDEGVDVPATRTAVILASSTNPRQYVQRRGRVLRKYKGKRSAKIFDFIVEPPPNEQGEIIKLDQRLLQKELQRIADFLDTASNKSEVFTKIAPKMLKYNVYLG